METSKRLKLGGLAEQISKLWKRPVAAGESPKEADTYLARALAKLNEMLARLNPKK